MIQHQATNCKQKRASNVDLGPVAPMSLDFKRVLKLYLSRFKAKKR